MESMDCICDASLPNSFTDTMSAACSTEKDYMKLYK